MKICHMTSVHGSNDGRIFYKECTSLSKAGYDVFLVAPGESRKENDVIVKGVGERPLSRLDRMTSFSRRVYEVARELDADLYHFHDPELLPFGMKLKRQGKKVVFDSHEYYPDQIKSKPYLNGTVRNWLAGLYAGYERHVLKHLDGLIVVSTVGGECLYEGYCENVATVSNVPLLGEFYGQYRSDVRKKERSISYVGGITEPRGVVEMVKAAAKAGCTVYAAGPFSSSDFERKIRLLEEASAFEYLGILGKKKVIEAIECCQIGASVLQNIGQHNKGDNFPTKVYEYMALGLPVVVPDYEYARSMIKEYRFGICVVPEDVDAIAQAFRYLSDNPDEAREMGLNGRKLIAERLNWDIEKQNLLSFYDAVLGRQ